MEKCVATKPPQRGEFAPSGGGRDFGNEAWRYHRSLDQAPLTSPSTRRLWRGRSYLILKVVLGTQIGMEGVRPTALFGQCIRALHFSGDSASTQIESRVGLVNGEAEELGSDATTT
jgi:hypothetical protein